MVLKYLVWLSRSAHITAAMSFLTHDRVNKFLQRLKEMMRARKISIEPSLRKLGILSFSRGENPYRTNKKKHKQNYKLNKNINEKNKLSGIGAKCLFEA